MAFIVFGRTLNSTDPLTHTSAPHLPLPLRFIPGGGLDIKTDPIYRADNNFDPVHIAKLTSGMFKT